MIAASVALTSHYSIAGTGNRGWAFRLNNWTGEVLLCQVQITASGTLGPAMSCRTETTDAEVVGVKDDWVPVAKSTDQFGGARVEPRSK